MYIYVSSKDEQLLREYAKRNNSSMAGLVSKLINTWKEQAVTPSQSASEPHSLDDPIFIPEPEQTL